MQPLAADPRGAPIGSPQFWRQPFRVPAAADPEQLTTQTIHIMCGHIRNAAQDPLVQETAGRAVQQFAGLSGSTDAAAIAGAAWWWCKLFVKFVHHELIARRRIGEAGHPQSLIAPEVLVRMKKPEGDCAIFSECMAAFLSVFGVPWELVTVAVNPREPDIFSHVYLYAVLEDGTRLPLDASHGKYPGWQVPSVDVFRRQVWDEDGEPVADQGSRFDGLHNYWYKPGASEGDPGPWIGLGEITFSSYHRQLGLDPNFGMGAPYTYKGPRRIAGFSGGDYRFRVLPEGVAGLGAAGDCLAYDPTTGECTSYDTSGAAASTADLCTLYPSMCAGGVPISTNVAPLMVCADGSQVPASGVCATGATAYTVPSQSNTAQYAAWAAQMLKSGLTLAEIQTIQPGTVVSANGAILRQSPGYAVPTGPGSSLSLATGNMSSMMPWLLLLGGAVVVMSMGGKG